MILAALVKIVKRPLMTGAISRLSKGTLSTTQAHKQSSQRSGKLFHLKYGCENEPVVVLRDRRKLFVAESLDWIGLGRG